MRWTSAKLGLYGTYFDQGFYFNTAVQGGYDGYEANRSSLGGFAHSSPTGGDFNLLVAQPGYNWTLGGLTLGATSRFQYGYQATGDFTETGSLAPLHVNSEHSESLISGFGLKASYDWKIGTTILRPELRLEWEHEYGDVSTTIASQLASGVSTNFTVTGPVIGPGQPAPHAGFGVVFSQAAHGLRFITTANSSGRTTIPPRSPADSAFRSRRFPPSDSAQGGPQPGCALGSFCQNVADLAGSKTMPSRKAKRRASGADRTVKVPKPPIPHPLIWWALLLLAIIPLTLCAR